MGNTDGNKGSVIDTSKWGEGFDGFIKGIGHAFDEGVGEISGRNKGRKNDFIAEDNLKIEEQNRALSVRQETEKNKNNDIAASNYVAALNNAAGNGRPTPVAANGATATVTTPKTPVAPAVQNPTADFLGI